MTNFVKGPNCYLQVTSMLKVKNILLRYIQCPTHSKINCVHSCENQCLYIECFHYSHPVGISHLNIHCIVLYVMSKYVRKYSVSRKGKYTISLFEIQFCLYLFELLTFEFKERKKQKRIKDFYRNSSYSVFVANKEYMLLSIL